MAKLKFKTDDDEDTNTELKIDKNSVIEIPIEQLELGENIRDMSSDEELEELGETIREYGQLEPCIVHLNNTTGKYVIDMGSRRYKACVLSDIPTVKCIVQDESTLQDEKTRIVVQAIENEHRRNMSSRERETYMAKLIELGMTQIEIAKALHKSKSWVSEALKAYSNYQKDKDLFDQLDEEINTRTMSDTSSLSDEELENAIKKAKESNNAKKTFSDEVSKIKKSKKEENIQQDESFDDVDIDSSAFDIGIEDNNDDDKKQYIEDVNNLDIRYSVTINDSEKEIKISTLTSFNEELNDFLKNQIQKFYSDKGYTVNA